MIGSKTPGALSWKTMTVVMINSQTCVGFAGPPKSISPYGPMELIPGYLESWLMSL